MRWTFALKSFPGALPTHNVGIAFSFSVIVLQNPTNTSCTPFGLSVLGDDATTTGLTWWLKLDGNACFFPTTTKPVRMDVIAWWCCAVSCNFSDLGCMWKFLQTPVKCQSIYVSVSQVWCVFEDLVYTLQLMKLLIQTCQTGSTRRASKCQSNLKALKCRRLASSPLQIFTLAFGPHAAAAATQKASSVSYNGSLL